MNTDEKRAFENFLIEEMGPHVLAGDSMSMHDAMQKAWKAATAAAEEKYLGVIRELVGVVNKQTEDDGLWFISEYITEAYLQKELRRLHGAIEVHAAPLLGEK